MSVTANMQTLEVETVTTGVRRRGGDDAFGEERETLRGLERRTRGIETHDTAVEQRLPHILREQTVVLRTLTAHHQTGVVGGRRHHTEHLTRSGLDGNDTTDLTFHQPFTQGLQLGIDAQRQVLAGLCTLVKLTVTIAALHTSVGIAQQNLDTFHTTQLLLVRALDTQLADIVAGLVVVVLLDIGRRHLSHIAQHVGTHVVGVLAHAALLHIEAWETEHLLLEDAEVLVGELTHEDLLGKARIAWVAVTVLDGGHATVELLARDAERLTELEGVETVLDLVHHHHDVVGGLVIHHQLAVPVEDGTTGGIFYLLEKSIGVGTLLVVVARNLEHEEADGVDYHDEDGYTRYDEAPIRETVIFHLARTLSIARTNKSVSRALLTARSSHICQSKKLKASRAKNTTQ